jgi:hypothetical protein
VNRNVQFFALLFLQHKKWVFSHNMIQPWTDPVSKTSSLLYIVVLVLTKLPFQKVVLVFIIGIKFFIPSIKNNQ